MRMILMILISAAFTFLGASTSIGSVQKVTGTMKVKSDGSIKKTRVKSGYVIKKGDLLTTSRKASAVIKLTDGSTLVLDAKSSIHFKSATDAQQVDGKIYYKITSRDAKNSLKIKTPFAIIGIKGTTFVVNATKNASVTLKEGLIGVASVKEAFNLYRKKVQEEFNKFKAEQIAGFEKFKSDQNKYAPPVKTKQFDLKAGNRISFGENRVNEDPFSAKDDVEFAHFEKLINEPLSKDVNSSDTPASTVEEVDTSVAKTTVAKTVPVKVVEKKKEIAKPVVKTLWGAKPKKAKSDDEWSNDDDAELDQIGSSFN